MRVWPSGKRTIVIRKQVFRNATRPTTADIEVVGEKALAKLDSLAALIGGLETSEYTSEEFMEFSTLYQSIFESRCLLSCRLG